MIYHLFPFLELKYLIKKKKKKKKKVFKKTRFFSLSNADDFYSRTFYNLRILRWQILNFQLIFYDIFLKLIIVNFVCVCLKKSHNLK